MSLKRLYIITALCLCTTARAQDAPAPDPGTPALDPPPCAALPAGAVAWWRAESNTVDSIGINDGFFQGGLVSPLVAPYTPGKVGAAFRFSTSVFPPFGGGPTNLFVPPSPELDVGQGQGLTIEGWIKPDSVFLVRPPIIEWNDGHGNIGAGLALSSSILQGFLTDTNTTPARRIIFSSPAGVITTQTWQHVTLTWDKSSGLAAIYVNGVSRAQTNLGAFTPQTQAPVYLAYRSSGTNAQATYTGAIDEMTIYGRALSTAEIQSIVVAAESGKCAPPPQSCAPPPAGIVGWWRGESNTLDSVDSNNGVNAGSVSYTAGEVGRAFEFIGGFVSVPASSNLNVGAGPGFTIETWVAPAATTRSARQFVGWAVGGSPQAGLFLITSLTNFPFSGALFWEANLRDTQLRPHSILSPAGLAVEEVYQHVAVTYDKTSGVAVLYFNGNAVTQTNLGTFTPLTTGDLCLGLQTLISPPPPPILPSGALDEVSLYSRALTASEIRFLMLSRSAGKCKDPPAIVSQPLSLRVNQGGNATFSVTASGNPLLRYQWRRNGTNISGAITTSLVLTNVQAAQSGTYSVRVTNAFGVALSSNAVLTLNHAPVADASATAPLVMVPLDCTPTVVLDSSRSSDPDDDLLHYFWFQSGSPTPIAIGVVAVVTLPLGSNSLTLTVDDGFATNSQDFVVEVITPAEGVERLIDLVEAQADKAHPLVASLNAAEKSIERDHGGTAINQLHAFQLKVHAQVEKSDPSLAAELIADSQAIIDILNQDCSPDNKPHGHVGKVHHGNGKAHLQFDAPQGFVYIIEASTNLEDWEKIGVASNSAPGAFEFEDPNASQAPARFYRIVVP